MLLSMRGGDVGISCWRVVRMSTARRAGHSEAVFFPPRYSRGASPEHGKHAYSLDPPRLATEKNAQRFGPGSSDGPIQHSPAEARHRGRAIVSFVDGHAEAMTLEQLGYDIGPDGVVIPHTSDPGPLATNHLWSGTGKDDTKAR